MRKRNFRRTMLATALIAAIPGIMSADPLGLPAYFVPTQADYDACIIYPEIDEPNWDIATYYNDDFEEVDAFACWGNYNEPCDDWLILPLLHTADGGEFTVSYQTRSTCPTVYSVCWGETPAPEALTHEIFSVENFDSKQVQEVSKSFSVPAGKNIYVAFHVTTPRGGSGKTFFVNNIRIEGEEVPTAYPKEPDFDIIMEGTSGTVKVVLPTLTVGETAIPASSMTAKTVFDGNEEVCCVLEGAPGAELEGNITLEKGTHTAVCTVSYEADGELWSSKPVSLQFEVEGGSSKYDYLDPEVYAGLPEGMFQVDFTEACQDGIRFKVTAQEQIMIYTNALFDERYITEDGLTEEDFADQILYISNKALETFGSWEAAQRAEFFYFGDKNIENAIVCPAGTRAFVAVMGLSYDEATNTVTPLTKLCRSEVMEYTADSFEQEDAWAEMKNPVYMEAKGKKVVRVEIELNSTAEEAYGKGFPADYREHNTDYEIIQYLTSVSNMSETLIFPMRLDVALEPGEQALMAVATTDRNGKPSKKLNWMLVEAPAELGEPVKVLATATGQAGIEIIEVTDGAIADGEYYSVSGQRVSKEDLVPGLYLLRQGRRISKVIVR